jgi:hypothetical protein
MQLTGSYYHVLTGVRLLMFILTFPAEFHPEVDVVCGYTRTVNDYLTTHLLTHNFIQ